MKARKIVLWTFVALLLSGTLFAVSITEDIRRNGGTLDIEHLQVGPGTSYSIDETESAETAGIRRIEIHSDSPDIHLTASNGATASVRLHGSVRSTSEDSVPHLVQERKGDTLVFRLERASNVTVGFTSSDLVLDAVLPEAYAGALALSGASSDISLQSGHFEELSIRTASGDLDLGTLSVVQALKLETVSGEIDLDDATCTTGAVTSVSGDKTIGTLTAAEGLTLGSTSGATETGTLTARHLDASTVSGDMTVENLKADDVRLAGTSAACRIAALSGSLSATTVSGDMTFDFDAPGRTITVESSSGAVGLRFPDGAGLDVTAQSTSGSVDGNAALSGGEKKEHRWTGTSGDKSVQVRVKTVSGDIRID